ncbi:MAG TPA: hypothetical protein VF478_06040, partial [Anaerolineae bacterium]
GYADSFGNTDPNDALNANSVTHTVANAYTPSADRTTFTYDSTNTAPAYGSSFHGDDPMRNNR